MGGNPIKANRIIIIHYYFIYVATLLIPLDMIFLKILWSKYIEQRLQPNIPHFYQNILITGIHSKLHLHNKIGFKGEKIVAYYYDEMVLFQGE